jgi:hypothetical protein
MMSTGFQLYGMYLAMKAHFEREGYDFVTYHGKIPTKLETFEKRNDRFKFNTLAKKLDQDSINPGMYFIATQVETGSIPWIGDLSDNYKDYKKHYLTWVGRQESLQHYFQEDLNKIGDLVEACRTTGGMPRIVKMLKQKEIHPETLAIIIKLSPVLMTMWKAKITDKYVWEAFAHKLEKYARFLTLDDVLYKKIIREHHDANHLVAA